MQGGDMLPLSLYLIIIIIIIIIIFIIVIIIIIIIFIIIIIIIIIIIFFIIIIIIMTMIIMSMMTIRMIYAMMMIMMDSCNGYISTLSNYLHCNWNFPISKQRKYKDWELTRRLIIFNAKKVQVWSIDKKKGKCFFLKK